MPEEGIDFSKNDKLLTIEELSKLSAILVSQGIDKIRITGGEPFVRGDLMVLLRNLSKMKGVAGDFRYHECHFDRSAYR